MAINRLIPSMPLEHDRAKFAYDKVTKAVEHLDSESKDEFKSWAQKFPSMVASCGLLQAAAFYKEKKKKKPTLGSLYDSLGEWLNIQHNIYQNIQNEHNRDLVYYLTHELDDQRKYMMITKEAIRFLTWVKRFAVILTE